MVASVESAFAALLQNCQRHRNHVSIVGVGVKLFTAEGDFFDKMRKDHVAATAAFIPAIFTDKATFGQLHQEAEYLRQTILHKEGISTPKTDAEDCRARPIPARAIVVDIGDENDTTSYTTTVR